MAEEVMAQREFAKTAKYSLADSPVFAVARVHQGWNRDKGETVVVNKESRRFRGIGHAEEKHG